MVINSVWHDLREDVAHTLQQPRVSTRDVVRRLAHDAGLRGLLLYRLARYCRLRGIPLMPNLLSQLNVALHGLAIDPQARLGHGVQILHTVGVVIGAHAVVEDDVWIYSGVVLGGRGGKRGHDGNPHVGKGALLATGAKLLGPITVGAHARVGANSVVLDDLPPHCTAAGVPARVLKHGGTTPP